MLMTAMMMTFILIATMLIARLKCSYLNKQIFEVYSYWIDLG